MTPFIVAEMSANHLGSLDRALRIVEAAACAGADAIKLQTWLPGTMCVSDYVMPAGPWAGRKLRDLYEEAHTPWKWHEPLFKAARALGLEPFSAAFDRESVDFLERLGVQRHKVASFEIADLPLIRYMASKGKRILISTGAATQGDTARAIVAASPCVATIVRCVSEYPAPPADFALDGSMYGRGLSDHSLGHGVAVAATALGAVYIEKHLTLSRADGGADAGFSMEPGEFAQMVIACRQAAAAVHDAATVHIPAKREVSPLSRSLWIVGPTEPGEALVLGQNVRTARPALGLPCDTPLQGRRASRRLTAGEPLTQECLA